MLVFEKVVEWTKRQQKSLSLSSWSRSTSGTSKPSVSAKQDVERKHVVMCGYPAYGASHLFAFAFSLSSCPLSGHVKYLCALAARMVHSENFSVTILVTKPYLKKIVAETGQQVLDPNDKQHIRYV